jgi:hypothetical protein
MLLAPRNAHGQTSTAGAHKSPDDVRDEKSKGEEPTHDDDDKRDSSSLTRRSTWSARGERFCPLHLASAGSTA